MMEAGLCLGTLSISHGMSASIIAFPENVEFLPSGERAGSWPQVTLPEIKTFQEIVIQRPNFSIKFPNAFLDILQVSFHISLPLVSL